MAPMDGTWSANEHPLKPGHSKTNPSGSGQTGYPWLDIHVAIAENKVYITPSIQDLQGAPCPLGVSLEELEQLADGSGTLQEHRSRIEHVNEALFKAGVDTYLGMAVGRSWQRKILIRFILHNLELHAIPWEEIGFPSWIVHPFPADVVRTVPRVIENSTTRVTIPPTLVAIALDDDRDGISQLGPLAVHQKSEIIEMPCRPIRGRKATTENLLGALREAAMKQPAIIHVVGGTRAFDDGNMALGLRSSAGDIVYAEIAPFANELQASFRDNPVMMVVLNVCAGARAGTTHGIAEALLRAGVQAVVAYTRWPSPQVTATVTEALYESLFKHGPMEGNIAAAVSAVRRRLDTQVLTDSTDRRESASLVVYLAGRDPILFASATNVVNAKTTPPNTIPETPNPRPPQPDPKRPPTNPKHGTVRFDAHVQGRLVAIAALVAFALVASALVWRNQYLETTTLPTTLPVSARPITPEPVPNPDPHPLVDLTAKTWGDGGTTFCTYLQDQKPPLGPSKCVSNTDPKLRSATPFDLAKHTGTNLVLEIDLNGRATIGYWGQLETATKLRTNFKPFDLSNLEMVKEAAPLLFALAKIATDRAADLGCVKMPQSNDPSLQLLGSFLRKMSKSPCRVTDDERLVLARESTCTDPADPMCTLYKYLYMDRLGVELKDPEISARAIDLEQTRHVEGNDLEVLLVNNARILSEQVDAATKQRAGTWLTSFRTPMMSACARVLSAPIAARVLTNASGDLKPIADLPPEVFNQCTDDLAKMKSYYDRGIARSFAEQFKEAAEDFHEAHKLDPANPLYRLHLARTWLLTKNPEEAYALLTKPIDLSKAEHDTKVGLEVLKVYAVRQLAQMGTSVVNGVPFTRDAVQVHLQKVVDLCKQAPANVQVVPCQPANLQQILSPNAGATKLLELMKHPPSVTTFRQLEHLFRIGR